MGYNPQKLIHMKKIIVLAGVLIFLTNNFCLAQQEVKIKSKADSLIHKYLFIDTFRPSAEFFNNKNLEKEFAKGFSEYFFHKDEKIRENAFFMSMIYLDSEDKQLRSTVLFNLLSSLKDTNPKIRKYFGEKLTNFSFKDDASEVFEEEFVSILKNGEYLNSNLILIAGYLNLRKEITYLNTLLDPAEIFTLKEDNWYFSSHDWATRLALARMGDKNQLNFVIRVISSLKKDNEFFVVRNLKDDLAYIQQPETTKILMDLLYSGHIEFYESGNLKISYETELLPQLQKIIKNFPTNYNNSTRKWLEKNEAKLKYKEDVFW